MIAGAGSYPNPSLNESSQQYPKFNTKNDVGSASKLKPKLPCGGESLLQAAEQTRLLHAATQKVTERAYHMQRAMENDDVCAALENACLLLEELGDPNHGLHHKGPAGNIRGVGGGGGSGGLGGGPPGGPPSFYSSAGGGVPPLGNYGDRPLSGGHANGSWVAPLTPKNYYELHMRIMDEMPSLEEYLLALCHNNSRSAQFYSASVLYETVHYCPRVVPRLYLQICMGAVSIRSGCATAVRVMEELGEAAKCVQCPVRGLFLRYYLLIALKDKLPDGAFDEDMGRKAESTAMNGVEEIAPPSSLTHGESAPAILDAGNNMPTSPPPTLPPPPPPLPPPPPPTTDCPLFLPSTLSAAPLFSNEPLFGEPETKNLAAPTFSLPTELAASETIAMDSDEYPSTNFNDARTGTVIDSFEFILRNLLEMNRLWIRIQHMPGDNTKETKRRRERERNDLRILVGSNLNRLSQLDGISAHIYGSKILPRILDEIASCRDPLAQAYLMDCIIHVFPNEYHLETLEVFLGVCPRLRDKVNLRTILNNMMERLLHYYNEEKLVNDEEDTNNVKAMMAMHSFDMFDDCVRRYFEVRGLNILPKDVIRLQGCLLSYALRIAPHDTSIISRCISQCARALGTLQEQKRASMMGQSLVLGGVSRKSMEIDMEVVAITELEKLLSVPLNSMGLTVSYFPDFISLLAFLPWENRKKVALSLVKSVIGAGRADLKEREVSKEVRDVSMLENLLTILAPLLRDEDMTVPVSTIENSHNVFHADFGGATYCNSSRGHSLGGDAAKVNLIRQDQFLVAKLVHALRVDETDVMYQMLNVVRKYIQPNDAIRIVVAFPPIVFSALGVVWRMRELEFVEPMVVPEADGMANEGEVPEELKDNASAVVEETGISVTKEVSQPSHGGVASMNNANEGLIKFNANEDSANKGEDEMQLFHGTGLVNSANCRKILVFLQKTVAILSPSNPYLAFKLYLEIAVATDFLAQSTQLHFRAASIEFTSIAYDFLTQAFLVYEDEISESTAQNCAITSIVGSLLCCQTFEKKDYEVLITKTVQYAAKLLKKPHQCRMVCLCSRLFFGSGKDVFTVYRSPQRVLECLQRGLKIADACSLSSSANMELFVEILDYYVYYYEIKNPVITDKFVSGLIALINEHVDSMDAMVSPAMSETKAYYVQILNQIKRKKKEQLTMDRFCLIVC